MCNNVFLLGKLMDNQSGNSGYVPSANHGLIANELVSVQPLSAPNIKLDYHQITYKYPRYILYPDGTIVLKRKRNRKPNNRIIL